MKNEKPNNQKQKNNNKKQNLIFQLRQFSIFFDQLVGLIDVKGIDVTQPI